MSARRHLRGTLWAVALVAFPVAGLHAQTAWADVEQVLPRGGQRGTEVTLQLRGRRLDNPQGLVLFRPGLEVLSVESKKATEAAVRIRIAEDCPLGMHPLRLRTARGVGDLQSFHVGALPEHVEDGKAGAEGQDLPLDCTVNGAISQEDVDVYGVEIPAGTRVTFEVEAVRLGGRALDLELELRDPEDRLVLAVDDSALGRKDPIASATFESGGRHRVIVRQAVPVTANVGPYRLHIGTFPRPTGAVPCGGRPGEELTVKLLGDPRLTTAKVRLPDDGREIFDYFPANAAGAVPPTPIRLRVGPHAALTPAIPKDAGAEKEPAKSAAKPKPIVEFPGAVHGVLAEPGERDRYYFRAVRGQQIEFRTVARVLRSPIDPLIVARYENGRYVASNDDTGGPDSFLRFRAPADGVFCIEIRDVLGDGSPEHFYRIEGGAPARPLTASMVVDRRRGEPVVAVPRGNRASFLLRCSNLDLGAGLSILGANLPDGATAELGPPVRGTSFVPVMLTASADAPLSHTLANFVARAEKEPTERALRYLQDVDRVRVENARPYLRTRFYRLPIAVAQAAPFRLELVPVTVPLVRGSPLQLRVKVERAQRFKGTVRLGTLWNPPGVSAGRINVPGNKDVGLVPLNANGNAQVGSYRIAVVGTTAVQGGSIRVSTGFADLQVDKPWITAELGRTRAEPGQTTELRVVLARQREFSARFRARLIGLPRGVATEKPMIDQDCAEVVFPLKIDAKAPPGRHRGFRLRLQIPHGDGVVVHDFRGGEIRIDRPRAKPAGTGDGTGDGTTDGMEEQS